MAKKTTKKVAKKATPAKAEKKAAPKKVEKKATPKVTKKSVMLGLIEGKGATLDDMAKACEKAGLGDFEKSRRVCRLWLPKLGVKVARDDKGVYRKAE